MRELKVGVVQASSSKSSQTFSKAVTGFLGWYQPIAHQKCHKSPVLNPTSKPLGLALTLRVSRATKMSRVWQWGKRVSIVQPAASEIVGFVQKKNNKNQSSC